MGTFTGYSSIAMALATADDAKVVCCEPEGVYANYARDWWLKAGCANKMVMHVRATVPAGTSHPRTIPPSDHCATARSHPITIPPIHHPTHSPPHEG